MISLLRKKFTDVCIGHFCAPENLDARRAILSNCLRRVEVEITSYCNRTCWFCPNSYIDRKSVKHFMDDSVYNSIVDQLASFNYKGLLTYSRYGEALSNDIIFERLSYARKMLPKASLEIFTNGDYLNEERLDRLAESGLDELYISGYLPDKAEYNAENIAMCIDRIEKKIGVPLPLGDKHKWNGWVGLKKGRINIIFSIRNFNISGIDRGGLIPGKSIERTSPCSLPFYELQVEYNGNVVPCCNIRSDAHEHKNYVFGNVNESNIFDIFFSKKAEEWRKSVFYFSDKLRPPCNTCGRESIVDDADSRHYCESLSSGRQIILEDENRKLEDKNRKLEDKNRELEDKSEKLEDKNRELEDKSEKLEDKNGKLLTTVSVSQALIHHIKSETWYRIGRRLGLLRHRTITDFRDSVIETPPDKRK